MSHGGGLAAFVLLAVLVGTGGPLLLYALVREERERNRTGEVSREEAERIARRDEE